MTDSRPHIAILGAGPTGLEAALAAAENGYPFTLYEASDLAAGYVRAWGHVQLFSPWDLDVSPRARARLERDGHRVPSGEACPTGAELAERVLDKLAALPEIAPHLKLGHRVVAIGRERLLKHEEIGTGRRAESRFRLLCEDPCGGRRWVEHADVVLDATGTWGQPNALGDGGIPAPGEEELHGRIRREIPDLEREPEEWAGVTTLLVGAGHSAQTAAVGLARLAERQPGTRVMWAMRGDPAGWHVDAQDPLPERSRLTARARDLATGASEAIVPLVGAVVEALAERRGSVEVTLRRDDGRLERVVVDRVLGLTGAVGDHTLYRQLQVHECYATSGPMKLAAALLGAGGGDCLAQESHGAETLVNPEPNFFLLGSKSYGRNNTFLMRVGWQQVDEVFGLLASSPS